MRCAGAISWPRCAPICTRAKAAAKAALRWLPSVSQDASIIDPALALCTPKRSPVGGQRAWRDHPVHPRSWSHASACFGSM